MEKHLRSRILVVYAPWVTTDVAAQYLAGALGAQYAAGVATANVTIPADPLVGIGSLVSVPARGVDGTTVYYVSSIVYQVGATIQLYKKPRGGGGLVGLAPSGEYVIVAPVAGQPTKSIALVTTATTGYVTSISPGADGSNNPVMDGMQRALPAPQLVGMHPALRGDLHDGLLLAQ